MLECALIGLFVDLGDALLASGDDYVDVGLLAAHQWANDFLNDPVIH
jgi:hypothetical protein